MTDIDTNIDSKLLPLSINQQEIVDFYKDVVVSRTKGPQLEGLDETWLPEVLNDPETLTVDLQDGGKWPLLVKIKHNIDYRDGFFEDHFPEEDAYYFSLPPTEYLEDLITTQKIQLVVEELIARNGIIAYDFQEGSENELLIPSLLNRGSANNLIDVTPESAAYGQSYGLPAVMHFEAIARQKNHSPENASGDAVVAFEQLVAEGKYEDSPVNGVTLLDKDKLTANPELLDNIWTMYKDQFDELVDDHPSLQIQPREELEAMLLDEDSFNIGFMEEGKVVGLCYFVSNIEKCVWLNKGFFDDLHSQAPNTKLAYFPGIVVDKDKARKGAEYATSMIGLVEKVTERAGIDMQIVFQCTNVSATYIPQIVTSSINNFEASGFVRPIDKNGNAFQKTAQYNYRVVRPV